MRDGDLLHTMRVSRKDYGTFDWQMHSDGWLDCPAQVAGNPWLMLKISMQVVCHH